jgi:hypothetical protein
MIRLSMENCVMYHLEFKGWGFSISATGIFAIVATVLIIALLVWIPKPF